MVEQQQIKISSFDAIFIDAAKGQYKRFFERFVPYLSNSGTVYCDNMFMHGMAEQDLKAIPKRKRTMIRNLKEFTEWMMQHPDFQSALFPIGDGILISTKKTTS